MHHGQLHRAAGLLHDHDFDHAQLRHVPDVLVGHAGAGVHCGVHGGVRVVYRVDVYRFVDTRESAVAVRPRPSLRRGILAESVAHHATGAADVVRDGQIAGRGRPENTRPAAQTGRLQTNGDNDHVPVLPAVQRVVRAHRVHDATAGQPARDGKQLSGDAGGRLHQYRRHGTAVGAAVAVGLQTIIDHIVHRLRVVDDRAGRVPVYGHRRPTSDQHGGHRLRAAEHGHERHRSQVDTVRDARRSVPDGRGRRGRFHSRVPVVRIQFRRHQNVSVHGDLDGAGCVRVLRRAGAVDGRLRGRVRAGHQREDHQRNRRRVFEKPGRRRLRGGHGSHLDHRPI